MKPNPIKGTDDAHSINKIKKDMAKCTKHCLELD